MTYDKSDVLIWPRALGYDELVEVMHWQLKGGPKPDCVKELEGSK